MIRWPEPMLVHVGCPGDGCPRCLSHTLNPARRKPLLFCSAGCGRQRSHYNGSLCGVCFSAGSFKHKSRQYHPKKGEVREETVALIRALHREGMLREVIARSLGCSANTVRRAVDRIGKYDRINPKVPPLKAKSGQQQFEINRRILWRKPYCLSNGQALATQLRKLGERREGGREAA